jgi:hypothetical protein
MEHTIIVQQLSGEHDQVGGLFSIFYCLIAYCLIFLFNEHQA